jgi:hypothetical protein
LIPKVVKKMALVLKGLGCQHALVVHGDDGLDEVMDDAQKKIVAEKMAQLLGGYPGNRFIITCRTAGWDPNLLPGGLPVLKIRDLDPKQVAQFIHDWYRAVLTNEKLLTAGVNVEKQAQALIDAFDKAVAKGIEARDAAAKGATDIKFQIGVEQAKTGDPHHDAVMQREADTGARSQRSCSSASRSRSSCRSCRTSGFASTETSVRRLRARSTPLMAWIAAPARP